MSSLVVEAKALNVHLTDDCLSVDLSDGRTISVPLAWYPRLMHGTDAERNNWRFIGDREGIHWPDLDEDISVENLLHGKPSGESQQSFKHWLEQRSSVESGVEYRVEPSQPHFLRARHRSTEREQTNTANGSARHNCRGRRQHFR